MARAWVRWAILLISISSILLAIFSPSTLRTAQAKYHDNASPGGINEKLGSYAPKAYEHVRSWWGRLFSDAEEPRGLQLELDALDDSRCKVYTYYDKSAKSEDHEALLQVWLRAWWSLGLFPVILTNEVSAKHPEYREVHKRYDASGLNMYKVDAILAMDQHSAEGMLMSMYVLPMTSVDDSMIKQMRQCQVLDKLSKYSKSQDDILRGSSMAYKIVVKALVDNQEPLDPKLVASAGLEAVPGVGFRIIEEIQTFAVYSRENVDALYPDLSDKKGIMGDKGVRQGQLASLVNRHLQNNFLKNHRAIEVLHPIDTGAMGSSLSKPSMNLAKALLRCNVTPLPISACPPNRASVDANCFDCSELIPSATIRPVQEFAPRNSTYFIGAVPHPLTTLYLNQEKKDFTPTAIRSSSRDVWVRKTLRSTLRSAAGAMQGLVFLSDSLWKNEENLLPNAHSWYTFERGFQTNTEYEVGFQFDLQDHFDEAIVSSADGPSHFQSGLQETLAIVTNVTSAEDRKTLETVEAWSQYDAGAHQLIQSYVDYKLHSLESMKAVNKRAFSVLELV